MVKRWQRCYQVTVRIPWSSGEKVNLIDLTVKDLSVIWGQKDLRLTIDLERSIQYMIGNNEIKKKKDQFRYQKDLLITPELIRCQPIQVKASADYFVMVNNGGESYLEQGVLLQISAWEKKKAIGEAPLTSNTLNILGRYLYDQGTHVETKYLVIPEIEDASQKLEANIIEENISLIPHGINFQGKLLIIFAPKLKLIFPLSIIIPKDVPAGSEIEGKASVNLIKIVEEKKVLLIIKIEWWITQDKPLQVLVSPPAGDEIYYLWELVNQETRILTKELNLRLPEKIEVMEQVLTGDLQSKIFIEEKGLLFVGSLDLDLFYIDTGYKEKCYQVNMPIEKWLEISVQQGMEYKVKVNSVRISQLRFVNEEELLLLVEIDYLLTEISRRESALSVPALSSTKATILLEKIITQEPIEYYVEIPLYKPIDFVESNQLLWRDGVTEGKIESGEIMIKVEPLIMWQYINKEKKIKVVEINPSLFWVHHSSYSKLGTLVRVKIEDKRMDLKQNSQGELYLQLLVTGNLAITKEETREVEVSKTLSIPEKPFLPEKRSLLKWEEKLSLYPREVLTVQFFLTNFRRVKTENIFLLEGEVFGEIIYLGNDGIPYYHRIKKDLWAKLPEDLGDSQVIVPVLTGWSCHPLPNWKWEQGGVWCEIALGLLFFSVENTFEEVNK